MEILDQEKSHFSCRVSGFSVLWKQTSGVTADLSTKQIDETQGSYLKFNSVIRATSVKQMGWESLESYQANPSTRENVRQFYHCRAGKWFVRVKRVARLPCQLGKAFWYTNKFSQGMMHDVEN